MDDVEMKDATEEVSIILYSCDYRKEVSFCSSSFHISKI